MAGSHRAPRAPKPRPGQGRSSVARPRALLLAAVVALVPALIIGGHRILSDDDPSASVSTDLPIPPVTTPVTSPAATPPATTPPAPTSAAPAPLPRVSPAAPRRITSRTAVDSGFDSAVTTLEPTSRSEAARWESRGSPGSPGTDTVYVVGEVHGQDSAFGGLPGLKAGAKVSIRTDNGTLTYAVKATTLVAQDRLEQGPLFTRHRPGRLVLVGVRYDDAGDRQDKVLVVTAQLSAAKRS